ncbi:MAG: AraC family transcriptional regulator [Tannerella sp.]|jgi:AraC-like DNA-binding protein|nr:AraC family transcriptional regulator [Tannerella sp.]
MDSGDKLSFNHLEEYFWYGETGLELFLDCPCRLAGGFVFLCVAGEAVVCHGVEERRIGRNMKSIALPGTTFHVKSASGDFRVRLFAFSREMFDEVSLGLGFSFSEYLRNAPFAAHAEDHPFTKNAVLWADMAALLSGDAGNRFRPLMMRHFLQCYLMYLYERIRMNLVSEPPGLTRKRELFHRFMSLLPAHCHARRDVLFYAEKLHITTRYLYAVTREAASFKSPKEVIDRYFVLEIKILLQSPKLSMSEIAYRLNFPGESYFCRYFKRHTGMSPKNYRMMKRNNP